MLEIADMDVNIGPVPILRGVSLEGPTGMVCGLIGRNGAGKTTLMRSVMGLLPIRRGAIRLGQSDLAPQPAHRRVSLGVGYMPEDRRLVPEFTAEENIDLPAWTGRLADIETRRAWIYELMPEVAQFSGRQANQLSGGQQKLVALARALMCGRQLLLLDEPFEGVAPVLAQRLADVLADLKREGLAILIADSNERHLAGLLDCAFVIERGRVSPEAAPTA